MPGDPFGSAAGAGATGSLPAQALWGLPPTAAGYPGAMASPSSPAAPHPFAGMGGGMSAAPGLPPAGEVSQSLEDIEIRTIRQVLDAAGGNISVAAKRLGISRNTIYRKLRWNGNR
jgi:DNA-binding NtrC family response regulator